MNILFQMRYSYFGRSGWRSRDSDDPAMLMQSTRLDARLWLLKNITLPSLMAQTDRDFHLQVLTSKAMPQDKLEDLRACLADALGNARVTVVQRGPQQAGSVLRRRAKAFLPKSEPAAVVVLDDDDALSYDFVATLRTKGREAISNFTSKSDYCFLSFPRGASLVFTPRESGLFHRNVPYTNLGLSLIYYPETKKNPYNISHRKLERRHPGRIIDDGQLYYLRSVHGINDSRAMYSADRPVENEEMPEIVKRFPLLERLNTEDFVRTHSQKKLED